MGKIIGSYRFVSDYLPDGKLILAHRAVYGMRPYMGATIRDFSGERPSTENDVQVEVELHGGGFAWVNAPRQDVILYQRIAPARSHA